MTAVPSLSLESALAYELLVDLGGCAARTLAEVEALRALADELVTLLAVNVLSSPQWHRFPDTALGAGGVTALYLLSESHLAMHSWPERGALLISVCCCRPLPDDDVFSGLLHRHLGSVRVRLRRLQREAP